MNSITIFAIFFLIFLGVLSYTKVAWVVREKDGKKVIKPWALLGLSLGLALLASTIVEQIQEGGLKSGFRFSMASGKPSLSFFGLDLGLF